MTIARAIVRDIQARGLAVGTPLPPEAEMARTFNVGRTSVREALRILEFQGLITIKTGPNGGPSVADPTTLDIGRILSLHLNIWQCSFAELGRARLLIDPMLARIASQHRTKRSIERLTDLMHLMDSIPAGSDAEWSRVASMFNAAVAAMAGNSVLALLSGTLRAIYAERTTKVRYTPRVRERAYGFYRAITSAIEKRDGDAAEQNMRDLITDFSGQMAKHHPEMLDEIVDWK